MSFTFSCCPIQQEESQQRHHTVNVRVPQTMAEAPISVAAAALPTLDQGNEEELKQEVPEVQPEAEEEKEEETALEEHKRDYSCVQVHRRY